MIKVKKMTCYCVIARHFTASKYSKNDFRIYRGVRKNSEHNFNNYCLLVLKNNSVRPNSLLNSYLRARIHEFYSLQLLSQCCTNINCSIMNLTAC